MPEVPADSDAQNSGVVFPMAETTPMPVTATRRIAKLSGIGGRSRGGRPRLQALDTLGQLAQALRRVHAVVGKAYLERVLELEDEAEGVERVLADLAERLVERHRLQR